ncbi:Uma2 family endonuclease [Archangium violaceum]|uniref:Uma2 family endonuclease n=1 Tax=Archangium violaceum TaxID=83451 RepID=UPI001EF65326|nr:Uma2 family endonuclease [Archangium violaceum]
MPQEASPETGAADAGGGGEKRKATYADLETVPFDHVAELVEGELYVSPHPGAAHMVTATELFGELGGPFSKGRGGPGGWRLMFEPELHLGEDVLVPDLGGWLRERMPQPQGGETLRLAPDWLCEVRTATSRALSWETKLRLYARAGVRHVWRADPETRTLEVLRLEGTDYQLLASHQGESRVHAEPFEAHELDLGLIWDE